jgi:hypothetical protein
MLEVHYGASLLHDTGAAQLARVALGRMAPPNDHTITRNIP